RVIGTKGKIKSTIEEISDTNISVYGNTIGIIGKVGSADLAETAVSMILNGASHGSVFNMLRKARQKMQEKGFY
ncbi:MAG: RNA-processing protein, partial [Candidatus Micrarchaeia archaeon]